MALVLDAEHIFLTNNGQVLAHLKLLGDKVAFRTLIGWEQVAQGLMKILYQELMNEQDDD
jgi:hypothetical protein